MKNYFVLFLSILSLTIFAQDKDYELSYDVFRKVEFSQKSIEGFDINLEELNKSASTTKIIEVLVGKDFSLIKTPQKINNSQGEKGIERPLRPEWLLNDYKNNLSYENFEHFEIPVKSSLKEPPFSPTGKTKKILDLDAKEYTFEDDNFKYSVWLTKLKDLSGSPLYYQFDGFLVLEVKMIGKILDEKSPKQEFRYVLNNIKEVGVINYEKLIPKKTTTSDNLKYMNSATPRNNSEGVDKD